MGRNELRHQVRERCREEWRRITGRDWDEMNSLRRLGWGPIAALIDRYQDAEQGHSVERDRLNALENLCDLLDSEGFLGFPPDWIDQLRTLTEMQRNVTRAARENTTLRTRLADSYVIGGLLNVDTIRDLAVLSLLLGSEPAWNREWTKPEEVIEAESRVLQMSVSRRKKRRDID
jgi:hypothetical protein